MINLENVSKIDLELTGGLSAVVSKAELNAITVKNKATIASAADLDRNNGLDAALTTAGKTTAEYIDKIVDLTGINSSASEIDNIVTNGATQADLDALALNTGNLTESQILAINNLDMKVDYIVGKNLFNINDENYIVDYFINSSNGNIASTVNFNATGWIEISPSTTYAFSKMSYLAWYDSNKTYISGLSSGQAVNYATSPANAKYLRASIPKTSVVGFQIELGTISTKYEEYIGKYNKASYQIKSSDLEIVKYTRNLFNKNDLFKNTYIDASRGELATNVLFHATNYIEIEPSTSYILSGVGTVGFSAWYDSEYKFISGVTNLRVATTSPSNARYVRTTSYSTHINSAQLEKGTIASAYINFTSLDNDVINVFRQYDLKKWSLLGDSITAQDSWQKIVALKFGLYYTNYAIGGTKISGTTNQSFVHDDRVNSIDINSDIVSVLGGTNDYGLSIPIGADDSTDITTFKGALNILIQKLCLRFPDKRIIFATTPYGELTDYVGRGWSNSYTNLNGNTANDYAEAIRTICKKNSIPYVDLQLLSGWNKSNLNTYTSDSIHPNGKGQSRIYNAYIKSFMDIGL